MEWILFALSLAALLHCLRLIYPYTRFSRKKSLTFKGETTRQQQLSLLSANVYMHNSNYNALLELVQDKNPDIILLLECDDKWLNAVDTQLRNTHPFSIRHPLPNTYGILFYSKYSLKEAKVQFLVEDDVPSVHTIIGVENGLKVQFFGLHPKPPTPGENYKSLARDAELVTIGRQAKASGLPCIVAGDLNDVAWSHTTRLFTRISGLLDPRVGRGFFNTFNAHWPLLRWPLDHFFLDYNFKVRSIERLENFGSDHFPIYIDLVYEPDEDAYASREVPDLADRIETYEIIDKADL